MVKTVKLVVMVASVGAAVARQPPYILVFNILYEKSLIGRYVFRMLKKHTVRVKWSSLVSCVYLCGVISRCGSGYLEHVSRDNKVLCF